MEMGMFFLLLGVTGALWRLTGGPTGRHPGGVASPGEAGLAGIALDLRQVALTGLSAASRRRRPRPRWWRPPPAGRAPTWRCGPGGGRRRLVGPVLGLDGLTQRVGQPLRGGEGPADVGLASSARARSESLTTGIVPHASISSGISEMLVNDRARPATQRL